MPPVCSPALQKASPSAESLSRTYRPTGFRTAASLNSYNGEDEYWYDPGNPDQPQLPNPPAVPPPQGSGTWSLCNIKNNRIHDVCLVMSDEGGIYLSGCNWDFLKTKGTLVQRNTIENVELQGTKGPLLPVQGSVPVSLNGIYVDSGAIGVGIENNHLSHIGGQSIFIHDLKTYLLKTKTESDPQFLWNEAPNGLALLRGAGQHATATAEWVYGNTPAEKVIP